MELRRPNWNLTKAELEWEFTGDKIIRDTKAYKGEYPAYSERDLSSRIRKRGAEVLESDLVFMITRGDPNKKIECVFDLFQDPRGEADDGESYPLLVRRNTTRFKMRLVSESNALKPRQKEVALLHLEGFSLRQIEQKTKVPRSTVSRYIQAVELWLELDRQRDLDRIGEYMEDRDRRRGELRAAHRN